MSSITYKLININELIPSEIREVRNDVVEKIKERIETNGYNPSHPLSVISSENGYVVADGNHRLKAIMGSEKTEIPCIVYPAETDIYNIVANGNTDDDTYAPMDLFDWIEIIRKQRESGKTQEAIGESIGWSREKVKNHIKLLTVIGTQIIETAKSCQVGRVPDDGTRVPVEFTEGWFRNSGIYNLESDRQAQFIEWLTEKKEKRGPQSQKNKISELLEKQEQIALLKNVNFEIDAATTEQITNSIESGEYTTSSLKTILENMKDGSKNKAIFGVDCLEELKKIETGTIDCVITDPPWGVDFKHSWTHDRPDFDDTKNVFGLLEETFKEIKRVTKDNAHIYVFFATTNYAEIRELMEKYFNLDPIPIIWKKNNTSLSNFKQRYAQMYETIFFAKKEKGSERELNYPQSPNVLCFDRCTKKSHDCQKPTALLEYLIKNSTGAKETVLDPFMGSGATIIAAKNTNRHYIGFELEKKYEHWFKRETA